MERPWKMNMAEEPVLESNDGESAIFTDYCDTEDYASFEDIYLGFVGFSEEGTVEVETYMTPDQARKLADRLYERADQSEGYDTDDRPPYPSEL